MQKYLDMDNVLAVVRDKGFDFIAAVAILVIGRILIGVLTGFIHRQMEKRKVDETLAKFLVSVTKIGLLTFVVIAAIRQLGVETNSFVAIIGAAGLAVGFALQGTLANFAAGVMLVIFKPFKVGDYIEGGGSAGSVDAIQIFSTILKSPDNKKVIIPNSKLTGDNITNYSAMEQRRIDMVFGIGYGDDLKKAKAILERIIAEDSRILRDPAPTVAVLALADSSINFAVRPWAKTADYWAVYFDLTEKVKLTFDAEGISIPFPQRDVHVHQAKVS
jgi:small conductance mechanosensitive channel